MQTFNEVVKGIRNAERNVDRVLKAARLNRVENGKMTDDRFDRIMQLLESALFGLGMVAVVAIFFTAMICAVR